MTEPNTSGFWHHPLDIIAVMFRGWETVKGHLEGAANKGWTFITWASEAP